MKPEDRILEIAGQRGIIRPRDVEAVGIPREYLIRLWRKGQLERFKRGLYRLPEMPVSEHITLMEVAPQAPNAVICLISALNFHELTTQVPHEVWIAIGKSSWRPVTEYPPLNVSYFSGQSFLYGIQEHNVNGVSIKVYSPAKTVADCFKFRNKVGQDVAIEALKDAWRQRKASMAEIWEAAKVCRVARIIKPYCEAIV
jgi:predicted transcriptional regulator of viral defense system